VGTKLKPYDIKYEPRIAIKGQVLTNFIVEFTSGAPAQSDLLEGRTLNADGASNSKCSGIGIILVTPEGSIIEQSFTLDYPPTNN